MKNKTNNQLLNDPIYCFSQGKKAFYNDELEKAEELLELAAKNPNIDSETKEKAIKFLRSKKMSRLYNSPGPIPTAASHRTTGGNTRSGGWSKWNYDFSL